MRFLHFIDALLRFLAACGSLSPGLPSFLLENFLKGRQQAEYHCAFKQLEGGGKGGRGFRRKNQDQGQEVTWSNNQFNLRNPSCQARPGTASQNSGLPINQAEAETASFKLFPELPASDSSIIHAELTQCLPAPQPSILFPLLCYFSNITSRCQNRPYNQSNQTSGSHHCLLPLLQVQQLDDDYQVL